jgi:hypothetical protein
MDNLQNNKNREIDLFLSIQQQQHNNRNLIEDTRDVRHGKRWNCLWLLECCSKAIVDADTNCGSGYGPLEGGHQIDFKGFPPSSPSSDWSSPLFKILKSTAHTWRY